MKGWGRTPGARPAGGERARNDGPDSENARWMLAVKTGVVMTLAVCAAVEVYILLTWDRPDRVAAAVIAGLGALGGLVVWRLPRRRIVCGRHRDLFFVLWSGADVLLIALLAHVELGSRSPFTLLFFLTLAFSSLFYPRRLVVAIGALNVIAFLAVGLLDPASEGPYLWFFSSCLAAAAWMCAWQASMHEGRSAALMEVSRTDALTGTLNRRGFEGRLDEVLERARRDDGEFGLVLLDLDGFKEVNDQHGHAAGDELLIWIARAIQGVIRPPDATGRLGGDEFAVLLSEGSASGVEDMAQRIRSVVGERAACSVGVGRFPADGRDAEAVLSHADADLYASKRGGSLGRRDVTWSGALARIVDAERGHEHSHGTAAAAVAIARRLGWDACRRRQLRIAAMLHDADAAVLEEVDGLEMLVPWVRHVSDRYDGFGSEDALRGEAIPLGARIIAVAEAYDELMAESDEQASLCALRQAAGNRLDPLCVETLAAALRVGELGSGGFGAGGAGPDFSLPRRGA